MDLGAHGGFVVAAYATAALVIALLVIWVIADHRVQRRAISAMEAQGVTRRSARAAEGAR
jgi:heme exporter protein D